MSLRCWLLTRLPLVVRELGRLNAEAGVLEGRRFVAVLTYASHQSVKQLITPFLSKSVF